LSTSSVAENLSAGTAVGTLSTADPDAGDGFTYALVSGAGDADNASCTPDASGNLLAAAGFDFETQSSYSIRVQSTDTGGLSPQQVITVRMPDVSDTTWAGGFGSTTATRYARHANRPGAPDVAPFAYGAPGWVPVVGDWDGDGVATIGVFDPATATWYLRN